MNRSSDTCVDPDPSPRPRAFVTATGYVFQTVGMVYLIVFGVYWFISGRIQDRATVRIDSPADYFAAGNVLLTVTTIVVLSGVAGGLGLVALGIGLQGERRGAGASAMMVAGALAAIGWIVVAAYVIVGPAWGGALVTAVWSAINTVLFLLAGHSAAILKRHPPPADQNVVDDAWLEQYERERRESRGRR